MIFEKEFRILKSEPLLFITLPFSLIILVVLRLLSPILLIRFGLLHSDRIGHFLINTELFFCEEMKKTKKKKIIDIFYFPTYPCNSYFPKMLKRKILILPKIIVRPFCLITRKLDFFSNHVTGKPSNGDYDVKNLLDQTSTQVQFTHDELKYGEKQLIKMGVRKNQKIICIAIRDGLYLKKKYPNSKFDYHDHRNEDIKNFISSIKYLIKKKYFVIRMGSLTRNKINYKNKNFLDYSKSKYRSDFMDLFISSKCDLFISNNTGVDAFGILFRKPILHIGSIPIGAISTYSNKIFNTLLNHYSLTLKRNLNFSEIFENNLHLSWTKNFFDKKKIRLIKFKPSEILDYVKEVVAILDKKNFLYQNKYEKKFKKLYLKNLKKFPETRFYHGKIKSHFLYTFLKSNKNFLK